MDLLQTFLVSVAKPRYEEDFADRLNYRITGYVLLAAAITLSAKSYVGKPIQCWVPAQFTGGWEQYVENYCFVENTYWVPLHEDIPKSIEQREDRQLTYYQWVPFVLALQALMFNIPHILWRMLNWLSGVQIRAIITMASDPDQLFGNESVQNSVDMIARHLKAALKISEKQSLSRSSNPFAWIARWTSGLVGAYVTMTYLFIKLLFILNLVLQFAILNHFLGTTNQYWGASILNDLVSGRDWYDTGHFPRVTMCDLEVRQLGNLHRWSIQCVLMINMFNEKVYLAIWWWFLVVLVVTAMSFCYWVIASFIGSLRKEFLLKMLSANVFNRFADKLIGLDGIVVLRLLVANAGEVIGGSIVKALWNLTRDELQSEMDQEAFGRLPMPSPIDEKQGFKHFS